MVLSIMNAFSVAWFYFRHLGPFFKREVRGVAMEHTSNELPVEETQETLELLDCHGLGHSVTAATLASFMLTPSLLMT